MDLDSGRAPRELHAARDKINKEKTDAQHAFILANMGAGGCGKSDLAPKLMTMPSLDSDGDKIYEMAAISREATRHYAHIFCSFPEAERQDGPVAIDEADLCRTLAQPHED